MLALRTGWTPDVLADLPLAFRAACHWALYGGALCGTEGLAMPTMPAHAPVEVRLEAQRARMDVLRIQRVLFPEDE